MSTLKYSLAEGHTRTVAARVETFSFLAVSYKSSEEFVIKRKQSVNNNEFYSLYPQWVYLRAEDIMDTHDSRENLKTENIGIDSLFSAFFTTLFSHSSLRSSDSFNLITSRV